MRRILDTVTGKIKDFFFLLQDLLTYFIARLRTERRFRIRVIAICGGILAAVLIIVLIAAAGNRSDSAPEEPDPESTRVIAVSILPSPTPTPAPRRVDASEGVSAGGVTSVNEYLRKKNS